MTAVWMLAAMVVAIRQALDYNSTARAVAVCVVGWVMALAFVVAMGLYSDPRCLDCLYEVSTSDDSDQGS